MLVCENCGGKGVQVLAWVDANTNLYCSEGPDIGSDRNWCVDCEKHVYLTDEDVFNENKDEED
jgi:thymidine kinase